MMHTIHVIHMSDNFPKHHSYCIDCSIAALFRTVQTKLQCTYTTLGPSGPRMACPCSLHAAGSPGHPPRWPTGSWYEHRGVRTALFWGGHWGTGGLGDWGGLGTTRFQPNPDASASMPHVVHLIPQVVFIEPRAAPTTSPACSG